jgi:hypothetical protein
MALTVEVLELGKKKKLRELKFAQKTLDKLQTSPTVLYKTLDKVLTKI